MQIITVKNFKYDVIKFLLNVYLFMISCYNVIDLIITAICIKNYGSLERQSLRAGFLRVQNSKLNYHSLTFITVR